MMERIPRLFIQSIPFDSPPQYSVHYGPPFLYIVRCLSRNLFFNFLLWWPFQTIVASRQIKFCKKKSDEAAVIVQWDSIHQPTSKMEIILRIASPRLCFGHDTKSIIMRQSSLPFVIRCEKLFKKVWDFFSFKSAHANLNNDLQL